ncbi:MAG: c-type cytochrome [Xanthomonadales bacterium]|nr:c-type cytochrome [Xanthomonadales bacterium]
MKSTMLSAPWMVACLAAMGLSLVSLPATAQSRGEGDAAAGQAGSAVCAACHGADGNSIMAQWPSLAGQHADYLVRQMSLIKSNARPVPEMTGIVANLTETDFRNLAAYFSSQNRKIGVADESLVSLGRRVYQAGNAETGVPACMACHGPVGEGNPLSGYPALAGQQPVYTAKMLTQFRSGDHWGEDDAPSLVMVGVAENLSDEEIEAVSSYIHGLMPAE